MPWVTPSHGQRISIKPNRRAEQQIDGGLVSFKLRSWGRLLLWRNSAAIMFMFLFSCSARKVKRPSRFLLFPPKDQLKHWRKRQFWCFIIILWMQLGANSTGANVTSCRCWRPFHFGCDDALCCSGGCSFATLIHLKDMYLKSRTKLKPTHVAFDSWMAQTYQGECAVLSPPPL